MVSRIADIDAQMQVYLDITALFDNEGQEILWGWLIFPSITAVLHEC